MTDKTMKYVAFGNDWGKIHKLTKPIPELDIGGLTVCGIAFTPQVGAAAWIDYDETRTSYCQRCKRREAHT